MGVMNTGMPQSQAQPQQQQQRLITATGTFTVKGAPNLVFFT